MSVYVYVRIVCVCVCVCMCVCACVCVRVCVGGFWLTLSLKETESNKAVGIVSSGLHD